MHSANAIRVVKSQFCALRSYHGQSGSYPVQKSGWGKSQIEVTAVTVSDSYVLARTYKSTDGILSHCKGALDIFIVYLGVYHAKGPILRRRLKALLESDCRGFDFADARDSYADSLSRNRINSSLSIILSVEDCRKKGARHSRP
jgi:hypothetical protein